jgi:hypothetical protein
MADQPTQPALKSTTATGPAGAAPAAARGSENRSLGRRTAAVVRRWARDTFSREQLMSSLKALMWVAPLTLLIWIYAEREQQILEPARFPIVLKSANPSQVVRFVSAGDDTVTADLRGPKARLAQAKEKLDPGSGGGAVQILIDGNRGPGQHDVDLLGQIEKDPRLEDNGVIVTACTPRYVRIEIDTLQEVELEVRAGPDAERQLASSTFEPAKVKVTAPASAIRDAPVPPYAQATLPPTLTPGRHGPLKVPVKVMGLSDRSVTVKPAVVTATLEVRQSDVRFDIPSVPVSAEVSDGVINKYNIRFDQFLPNVPVWGPPDKIQQLRDGTLTPKPRARFAVSELDYRKRTTADLEYVLPPGITLRDEARKTIEFDLVPQEGS